MKDIFKEKFLRIEDLFEFIKAKEKVKLEEEDLERVKRCRIFLEKKINKDNTLYYGINTGFGSLCDVRISEKKLEELQENLLLSHSCGVGEPVPLEIVRIMLLFKILSLIKGYSGVRPDVINLLTELYNRDILPVVYDQGSLGSSGDLAPLAHLSLPLIGKGKVYYKNQITESLYALNSENLQPIKLKAKEGLALINGTQFSLAYATYIIYQVHKLFDLYLTISALSYDAFMCRKEPLFLSIHRIRPHKGQIYVAKRLAELLSSSEIFATAKKHVQDPYSFRCIPQVLGPIKDTLDFLKEIIEIEINSVTDNPLIFEEENNILTGGNFHGEPIALAMDYLSICLTEMANISERRIYQLISGKRNLPVYLIKDSGLNSGFMIAQYVAASIVGEMRSLSAPLSVHTIDTSLGQEDHVSFSASAAVRTFKQVQNLIKVLAIELLIAAQAIEFRKPLSTSSDLQKILNDYRKEIPFITNDCLIYELIEKSICYIKKQLF